MRRLLRAVRSRHVSPPARRSPAARGVAVFLAAGLLAAAALAQAPAAQPSAAKAAEYVGSDTCQPCHEDIFKTFQQNSHHAVETGKKWGFLNRACESCHGPGSKHAESVSPADIRQPAKLPPEQADAMCLRCHRNQPTQIGRINSSHAKNQVSCVACHAVHKNGPHGLVARTPAGVNQLCAGCHTDVWASFQRPFKHRLPEGAMSCVNCHNPHGGFLAFSLQTVRANEPGCLRCHGDKAGPFVYPHAPVNLEGCMACHQPHGSANPRMLRRSQVYQVCLECHANLPVPVPVAGGTLGTVPPAFHDLRDPRFRNCTVCHQKVHGSYVNRALLK